MEFLSQTYVALRGPAGAPQSPEETIARLADRLVPSTLLSDRRAAVLALKGLARDCKRDVGDGALTGLLYVLVNDAQLDPDISKAVLETLLLLCDADDGAKELGYAYTDTLLADEHAPSALFTLLGDTTVYTRLATLRLLATLLRNRRQVLQGLFLKAPSGPASVMSLLEDKRDMIRSEAVAVVQALTSHSPDIQKILAFEGAFEKLFNVVTQEGGIDGRIASHDSLSCVDSLLRFNAANQSYFRESQLPPILCHLLLFPPALPPDQPAPQQFALQFWDDDKRANASVVIGIIGMLVASRSPNTQNSVAIFDRCLIEIALASNFPTSLKTQALRLLPANFTFPLSELHVTPYMPVPETNGEEWDRLEPASALDVLVELALNGEYNGLDAANKSKDSLELRTAAACVFENFVRPEQVRTTILRTMVPSPGSSDAPPVTPLLYALVTPPNSNEDNTANRLSTQMAALLFAHLLRGSPPTKELARAIKPGPTNPSLPSASGGGSFFVPADGTAAPPDPIATTPQPNDEDDEPPQSLLHIVNENLSLALLSRSRPDQSDEEAREWDKLVVTYVCLLAQWLWEDPLSVRDYLDSGGLSVLVEPINQTSELDPVVPGLCALLLGICYEFNRTPGEITRSIIYPILNRLGVDGLIGKIIKLREDERFKVIVGPDSCVMLSPSQTSVPAVGAAPGFHHSGKSGETGAAGPVEQENAEIWFDWAFVDFWKSNYYTIQRGLSTDPDQLSNPGTMSAETATLISSLKDLIRKQSEEIASLKAEKEKPPPAANTGVGEIERLKVELEKLGRELTDGEEKRKEMEKEQEDLLVLLDEVNAKRSLDKKRMRDAGMEVSEDEDE